jgi:hypothetical protein
MNKYREETYVLGLSLRPPRREVSWQAHRMYLIRPSLSNNAVPLQLILEAVPCTLRLTDGFKAAVMRGQHPPTQWE